MSEETIKEKVREHYRAVAIGQSSCCGTPKTIDSISIKTSGSCCGSKSDDLLAKYAQVGDAMVEHYTPEELASVPEGADLGLGCGVPTHYAKIQRGETVVDLGSGPGVDCFLAAQETGSEGHVIGIDMLPEMIAKARKNSVTFPMKNVEFRLGEIEHMPIEKETVDIVISNCVLNLVPNKFKAFSEIARILKPGGRTVVSDMMVRGDLPDSIRNDLEAWAGCISGAADIDQYLNTMREAGLSDVAIVRETPYEWGGTNEFQVVSCIIEAYKR
ncbi:MAG: arsenite methyltransferase [bacterium]|nr:arsenite methyltransferase [bacterium]